MTQSLERGAWRRSIQRLTIALMAGPILACGGGERGQGRSSQQDTVLVFVAASLTNALKPQLDSFAARSGTTILTESGGSMEHARKMTDLQRIPDLVLLADDDVFPRLLAPAHVSWWAAFARNRIVVAYTDRSKAHDSITSANWPSILTRPGVEVGRADPNLAPVGYRTLAMFVQAALFYRDPQLAGRLAANAPPKNVRANAAELAALLATGELDYIYDYESVAHAHGFKFVTLPDQILGRPVLYALSIPTKASHPAAALSLLEYLLTPEVRARMRASYVDMLDAPVPYGTNAPAVITPR